MKQGLILFMILLILPIVDAGINPQDSNLETNQRIKETLKNIEHPESRIIRKMEIPLRNQFFVEWQSFPLHSRTVRPNNLTKWEHLFQHQLQDPNKILPDADTKTQICSGSELEADNWGGHDVTTIGNGRYDPLMDATNWGLYGFKWEDTIPHNKTKYGLNKLNNIEENESAFLVLEIGGIDNSGEPAEEYLLVAKEPIFGFDEGHGVTDWDLRHFDKGQRIFDSLGNPVGNFIQGGGASYLGPTQSYDWAGNSINGNLNNPFITKAPDALGLFLDNITVYANITKRMVFNITSAVKSWQLEQRDGTIMVGLANYSEWRNQNVSDGTIVIGATEGDAHQQNMYLTVSSERPSDI
tara:strand:- start:1668 stop:2729 length:1062 start_codon:yes stop_codon:yes gene_type:complete